MVEHCVDQRPDKRGAIAERVPKLLERLNIELEALPSARRGIYV